jgi:twitching motility protein PilT
MAVGNLAAAAVAQAARETVAEAVPAAVAAAIADAVPGGVAEAARIAVGNVADVAVEKAARETVANATHAAVTAAVVDTVPGAVADAARIAVANVAATAVEHAARNTAAEVAPALVSAAVFGAVADAVPGAVAEAVRNAVGDAAAAVSQAARETVAEIAPGAVVDAARAAVSTAAAVAVRDTAREIVADVASAAVAAAVPGAVIDAARTATAAVVLPAIEKAARERVAEAVPPVVAEAARMAVSEAVAVAVAHAAGETVAKLAPAAVVAAARIAVNEGAAAAVTEAAREAVAEAAPAAMAAAVSAAVEAAVPGAVADAARVAVADVAAAVVAKALAAALSAAATATEAQIASGDVFAPLPSGERSSHPRAEVMPPGEVVKPLSAAVLEFAPSRLSPPRAPSLERAPDAASARAVDTRLDLERLLRVAAARRTTTLYLFSNAQPSIWVDGQPQTMDGEPVFSASDVFSVLLATMPEANREALRLGVATEWTRDVEGIGQVNCRTFSDHRGPGGVFRIPLPALTADQLGLTQDIQSLAQYSDGLVLVAGSRFSGKQTLMSALVDLINRTRQGYVITLEEEVTAVHGSGHAVISQRQVRPSEDDLLAAAHSALRENPNVLVLDEIRTGASMNLALEAASSGRLIIAGLRAHSASEAIDRIVSFYAPEHSGQIRLALAQNLRGIVAQVLLTARRGGRVAAREVVNAPGIAAFIAGEATEQPSSATEGGRRDRMGQLADVLADYVEHGVVDVDEACRHVTDRSAFAALLRARGIDSAQRLPGSLG